MASPRDAAHGDPSAYRSAYDRAEQDPEGFWLEAAEALEWTRPPTRAVDDSRAPLHRWFPDGRINTSVNCLDRHVAAGRATRTP